MFKLISVLLLCSSTSFASPLSGAVSALRGKTIFTEHGAKFYKGGATKDEILGGFGFSADTPPSPLDPLLVEDASYDPSVREALIHVTAQDGHRFTITTDSLPDSEPEMGASLDHLLAMGHIRREIPKELSPREISEVRAGHVKIGMSSLALVIEHGLPDAIAEKQSTGIEHWSWGSDLIVDIDKKTKRVKDVQSFVDLREVKSLGQQ